MDFTFDTFRIDETNRFAYAAALAVAEAPARSYDPLWIYGPSGAGKTHLLGAIERAIRQEHRGTAVGHVSLINPDALNRYADDAHVLLLDDAENLHGSCELFTKFNDLMVSTLAEDFQVVVASQLRYDDMHQRCCDHVLSRLPWWLEVDISSAEAREI